MRSAFAVIAVSIGVAVVVWPQASTARDRDFVFEDEEGHLVLRFAGAPSGGLSTDQAEEVLNAEFSSMVHDRLRADLRFEAEPVDSEWARAAEPGLGRHVRATALAFSAIAVECRSSSCRLVLEHGRVPLPEHQNMLATVQRALESFIDAHPSSFDPVFLIAAYDQLLETPSIKAYLRRAGTAPSPAA